MLVTCLFSQYIPSSIRHHDRQWRSSEKIILRTKTGEWMVGLSVLRGNARCSAGWNKFSKDNKLKKNETLTFTMIGDEGNGVIFNVTKS